MEPVYILKLPTIGIDRVHVNFLFSLVEISWTKVDLIIKIFWMLVEIALMTFLSLVYSTDDSFYVSQLKKCVKSIKIIPTNISNIFDIKSEKNHIELVVKNHRQYDYYEMNWKGYCCYKATGLDNIPLRTDKDQEECDNYQIGEKMDFYTFRCAYEIIDDKTYSIVVIHSMEESQEADVYFVNKETGDIIYRNYEQLYSDLSLYVPHDQSDDKAEFLMQLNECLNKKKLIPKDLPINFEITKRNRHIEILAYYENKFDYYEVNWKGVYCYRERGVDQKPNRTMEDLVTQCDNRPLSSYYDYGAFNCAYDFWTTSYEGEDYLVFYVEQEADGNSGSNAYIINISKNKVVFYDFQDKFSGETIFERYKEVDTTIAIKECSKRVFNLPIHLPIELKMFPENKGVNLVVAYENKFDYYELNWNSSIRYFKARLDEFPGNLSVESSEEKDFEFKCPYSLIDDKEYTILVIEGSSTVPDNLPNAYAYFINRKTFEITFEYYSSYHRCILEVPLANNDITPELDKAINSCVNQKNFIPSPLNAFINISRKDNHIEITVKYDDEYDYYEMNYKGLTCYIEQGLPKPKNRNAEEAVRKCENRRITSCADTHHTFDCGFEVFKPDNDHYAALIIRSAFDDLYATAEVSGANVYLMDELTHKVDFMKYSAYNEDNILVEQTESDKTSVYMAEFEDCLNLRNSIPRDIPIEFNVTKVGHHINILVFDNGKYDYYEYNVRGEICFTAVRMEKNPTRPVEDQKECDARRLKGSLKPYSEEYQPQFRCGYELIKNDNDIVVLVHSTDGVYEYNIDRTGRRSELYLYQVFNEPVVDQENKCIKRKYMSDFKIPLEVTKKPKNFDNDNYLEILVTYQGKYDLYVTEESGYVRYSKMQLQEKPNLTLSDYSDKIQCQQNTNFRVFHLKSFRCPLKVVENENYVNISVNAFHYENVYVIDKSSNDIQYFKVKDNLILSNLPIPDPELNYLADVNDCFEKLTNSSGRFPVDVWRHNDFLEIIVKYNETFDIYETTSSGGEMCKITTGSLTKPMNEIKSLEYVHPECVSCDGPPFTYTCPTVNAEEDENKATLEISHGPGLMSHLYTLIKSTGELIYADTAVLGPPQLGNVIKSLIAFLSSVNSTRELINYVLSVPDSDEIHVTFYDGAIEKWSKCHSEIPQVPAIQKNWDNIVIKSIKSSFNCTKKEDSARFLASQSSESSSWLKVLPSKTIGTLLQDNVFRISIALRYGCNICIPHKCNCGKVVVNSDGIHGLSCQRSAGGFARHSELNLILKLALSSAQIPSRLEPIGLNHNNKERTDGVTLIPWSNGRFLTWDATCRDTLAPSYIDFSCISAGKLAERAANDKRRNYRELLENSDNIFVPFAIETLGPICIEGKKFLFDIGKKIETISGEARSTQFLFQRISIALQNYNAGCVMGTLPDNESLNEIFLL